MYFTRFPINMPRRSTQRMLASPYRLHAAIAGSFSPQPKTPSQGRVLWRVDDINYDKVLYIVSPQQPDLTGLNEQIGWPDLNHVWETREYGPFLAQIAKDQLYAFRLVANPVVSRTGLKNDQGRSRRVGHLTPLQHAAWLIGADAYQDSGKEAPMLFQRQSQSRAERNGFVVERDRGTGWFRLVVSHIQKLSFTKEKGRRNIEMVTARFDGVLRVTNPDALRAALVGGIGHGKGFGCGLLTLMPLHEQ